MSDEETNVTYEEEGFGDLDKAIEEKIAKEEPEHKEHRVIPALSQAKPVRRKSTKKKKKSSGVSAKKSEVKPVDEAKAEPAVVTPPASMSVTGDRISVQSLWPARLVIRGTPSGEEYVWAKSGALEAVNPVDVDFLMSKNRGKVPSDGRGCCGGDGTRTYFQLA